jgi:hypothetical protein
MRYAVEMDSGAMIYVPSFMKIGSGIRKLMGGIHRHKQQGYLISLFLFSAYYPYFVKIKVGLSDHHVVCVSVYPPYQLSNA